MAGDAVELQLVFFKRLPDEMRPGEFAGLALDHVVAGLGTGCAGFLGKG